MKLAVAILFLMLSNPALGQSIKIKPTNNASSGFDQVFKKSVIVFGIPIYATTGTPNKKILHAAHVLAQYLDNDGNGKIDNKLVVDAIIKSKGAMVMFATEQDFELTDIHLHISEKDFDKMTVVALFGDETHPDGAKRGVFDATLEEVLHLITSAGYAKAYPKVFGEKPGTEIAKAMDKARGGHFRRVPKTYPANAWYSYYDKTCDYSCQITEYIYWGITSVIGAQNFPGRLREIENEWKLNTKSKVKTGDPALYSLLTDRKYAFPTRIPDGKYKPKKSASNSR